MDNRKILLQEYNNLWNEKLVHKQSIRKFHNYLTYITAIGSLALTFHGLSFKDAFTPTAANQFIQNAASIVNLFFIPFTPVVIITLTFPLNDLFHIYIMGNQLAQIEKKINTLSGDNELLVWEHLVCPTVYGGQKVQDNSSELQVTNIISRGDVLLLAPALGVLCIFTSIMASMYICNKAGCFFTILYDFIVLYMIAALVSLVLKIMSYVKPDSVLTKIIQAKNPALTKTEVESVR